jgi:CRP/FNR family transcriptional regulator, anaerobic regulatory protein
MAAMNKHAATVDHAGCAECPIRHRAVCAKCEADELAELENMKTYRSYAAGQPIAWEGETAEFVGSVVHGVAALTQTMVDGRRQMVGLLLPSDFMGRPGRTVASFDVTAVTDLTLCCFQRKPFERMMAATPRVAERLLEMTLDELDAAREWMLLLGRKTARERIASLMVILARRSVMLSQGLPKQTVSFVLPLTREAMADYLGLTLETVSRQISQLKSEGVVVMESSRNVTIPDLDRLLEEAGDDSDGGALA